MAAYEIGLLIIGFAILGAAILPRLLEHRPLSFPIIYVTFGLLLFTVIPGTPSLNPVESSYVTERLTELVVIISLMGAGLKIDRPFSLKTWSAAWRLILIALPITAGVMAVLAWGIIGLLPATAILLGAVIAPTDPVLASGVGSGAPLTELEEEQDPRQRWGTVRFSLTAEAGFNDGLAFPLTNLAIAAAGAALVEGASWSWLVDWVLVDVLYKIAAGVVLGYVIGNLMGRFLFRLPTTESVAEIMGGGQEVMAGIEALATTLIAYSVTELLGGYGFIAVFVGALTLRHFEWEHDYYVELHDFAVVVERLLMATVLVLFGGAIAGGLLGALTWTEALIGMILLLVVRPVAGILSFIGTAASWPERAVIGFFGIRGIGSFYYLSHALAESSFQEIELLIAAEQLWAFVGFVVLMSIILHGMSANPVMNALNRRQQRQEN
ncbi:cation:proton antiporter [Halorubrum lacusprofundi]|jgi:NhaP-type Na+/H+ or K+/H+ antiporter|uniref:Sodium/hydrogen exchanger n=1 Tax=Halorubrum lacusprofundi (strain ATCC 49239 / DSM 5036 / JCM 8891 / ACAM 34) TaxID=416348 RepID=B9LQB2_HALLT|nr:cation:proton antiporter [Halorubrum lacusprofundi]ACM57533.1 sodium/hydrogen exchanger [Halorubrum lacusprofundi ATCC 49239]MCG1005870.1 cation:proton antiporter [Halorubrum lacusprofundi]